MRPPKSGLFDDEVLTLQEISDYLRVAVAVLEKEVADGILPALMLGTETRVFRRDFDQYLKNKLVGRLQAAPATRPTITSRGGIQFSPSKAFKYRWPHKSTEPAWLEEFTEVYEGISAGRRVTVGFSHDPDKGIRGTVFVNRRPMVRFKPAKDFAKSGLMVSIIKTTDRKQLRPDDLIPPEYVGLRVETYRNHIDKPHASSNLAVVCEKKDLQSMAQHALVRADQIEERRK